jgi:acetyl-CoA acyltransferase
MSMVPMTGYKFAPLPYLAENYPAFTSMGLTAENVAVKWISRRLFALRNHQAACGYRIRSL